MSSMTTNLQIRSIRDLLRRRGPAARALIATMAILAFLGCKKSGVEKHNPAAQKAFAAMPGSTLFIPASAHVSGALGTNWRTDLQLLNPGTERSTVTIALLPPGQANLNPTQKTVNIEAGRTARYTDVLSSMFGFSGGAALRITNSDGMVAVTSRTYNLTSSGTYGQFVGGVLSPTAINAGQEGRIIQLTHNRSSNSGFRTNIGFVNIGATDITVNVDLYTAQGALLGTRSYPLRAYEFAQKDKIYQQVTNSDVDDGYAVLSTPTAGAAFFAYATVIDNRTGDPIYVTPVIRPAGGGAPAPTTTPNPTGQPTPTRTPTPTATPTTTPGSRANLAPYQPSGWSGALVVSGTTGTNTSGGLSGGSPSYFDWAMANFGDAPAVFPAGSNLTQIRLDGSAVVSFYTSEQYTLEAGYYTHHEDYQIDGIGAGQHTATLVCDPDPQVAESNENDNTFDYVGTWGAAARSGEATGKKIAVPRGGLVTRPIPGWGSADRGETRRPVGIEWLGQPPLRPGSYAAAKAASYGDAVFIPAAAHVSGAVGTNWRTDLQLHNPGPAQARYEIFLLKRDQANASPQVRTYTVNAGHSLRIIDVLDSAFGFTGAASLRIVPLTGDLIASSRTYNLKPDGRTYGQFAGAVNELAAFAAGERAVLMQLTHDTATTTGFRTNVGMVNCSAGTVNLTADFRTATGASLGTKTYPLRPWEFIQKDRIFREITAGVVPDGYILLTTDSEGARFLAYATVVDNTTGDSVFIPAISVLGQEPAAINTLVATQAAFETLGAIGAGQIPSIEQVAADLQAYGIEQVAGAALAQLPPGIVTQIPNGVRVDFGSHMVMSNGQILSGSFDATYSNLVISPTEISFDFSGEQESMLWNGGYAEIDGLSGRVDTDVRAGGGVSGEISIASFNRSTKSGGVTVDGSAFFDTDICPNYPISGSLTVSKDGQDYTIEFNDDCDGTFEAPNQGQTGDVSFRLTWSGPQDLDIYVKEPNGNLIYWGEQTSSTGGQLDVDSNAACGSVSASPTENVFWPEGSAPHGTYEFWAVRYDSCGATDMPAFTIQVFEGNSVVRTINGVMPAGGESAHYTHTY